MDQKERRNNSHEAIHSYCYIKNF